MAMFLQLFLLTGMSLLEVIYGRNASTAFCSKTLTDSSGSLSSPEDDIVLSSKNLDCQYDINVGAGNAVRLEWTKFELNGKMPSCLENYVEIFIGCGRHSIGRYCSNLLTDDFYVYSPDSCLRIIYHTSDSYDGKGGIKAYYKAIPYYGSSAACNKYFTSYSGTVTSPEYNSRSTYANSLSCRYDIRVGAGNAIKLTWSVFDIKGKMPSCTDDYVEIFIGCRGRSIGKYCSDNSYIPHDIYSPDNCLRIKFRSDSSVSGRGFYALYETISLDSRIRSTFNSKSGTSFYSNSAVISSSGWPQGYSSLQDCYWKIEVGSYKNVKIAFMDLDLEYDFGCDNDKVKVKGGRDYQSYDSSITIKDSKCGKWFAFYFTSTMERIWIRFKSNSFRSGRGFVAGYVVYDSSKQLGDQDKDKCTRNGQKGSSGFGNILSPRWPLSYPPSQDCFWRINKYKSSKSRTIYRIIFMDFNLPYDAGCHNNTVIIKGGAASQPYSALTAINGSMCGRRNPFYLTITAEKVWIRFKAGRSGYGSFAIGFVSYEEDTSLSGGAVAGIVVSIIAFLAFVGCLVVYLRRRARRQSEQLQRTAAVRDEQAAVTRRAAARRAAAHHPPTSAPTPTGNASPPPQQSNTPPPKRQGEQQQSTAAVYVATQRAAEHYPPPSAPPPTSNASSPPQQRRNTPSAQPPEPDYAPPSYSEIMAKAYPK